ncbi:hypothetical protein EGW08_015402 [Elysia chlorotica]|uniref:SAM domain-containing protein n=1 Tax=Elysia chlorotica TaxID=188477 RepID=A0A3S0ZG42_ELYCH|nr:hypothetical protein EGW08_015402 [Elysia chlorotica]
MDVSHTEHSHVIGKGGNNIKRVMTETGCHIHFPDSNRGSNLQEKSNQVSIAGQPDGVEIARAQIRELLPLVFMFELPVTSPLTPAPDVTSPLIQQLQQTHGVTVTMKQRARSYGTSVQVRGSVHSAKQVKQATGCLMEQLAGNSALPVSTQLEIAPQHHLFIIGRGAGNVHQIMQQTGAHILFPDPATATPQRRGTVFISGGIESVFLARQYLMGCLPLVLMFDVKEAIELDQGRITQLMETLDVFISVKPKPKQPSKGCLPLVLMFDVKEAIELDQGRITQLMETLDVFISVKPKPKQPSKSVIVKSIERNARNMYLAREILVGLRSEANIAALLNNNIINNNNNCSIINNSTATSNGNHGGIALSLAGLNLLSPRLVSVSTNSFLLNGHHTGHSGHSGHWSRWEQHGDLQQWQHAARPGRASSGGPGSQRQSLAHTHTRYWGLTHTPITILCVYSPLMVVTPASSTLNSLTPVELLSPHGPATHASLTPALTTNGFHHDFASSAFIRVSTPLDPSSNHRYNKFDLLEFTVAARIPPNTYMTISFSAGHSSTTSESTSPPHSPSNSPSPVGLCGTAADLAHLQKSGTLSEALSHDAKASLIAAALRQQHQHQQISTSATSNNSAHHLHHHHHHHHQHLLNSQQQHHQHHQIMQHHHSPAAAAAVLAHHHQQQQQQLSLQQHHYQHHHHHGQHPLEVLGLSKTASLTQLSSMVHCPPSPTPLFNGMAHAHGRLLNGDSVGDPTMQDVGPPEKLSPGMERKDSATSLFASPLQFAFDYEQKKLLAMKAMQKKPEGESRIPTDIWAGMGFSRSMPESAIRDKLGQMGISARVTDNSLETGYEPNRPEIDLSIDQDLWAEDGRPERTVTRPLNKAPGEYPSPRKKVQYGLSHSNHVDSASLPPNKSVWSAKTGLAELFSALGLSKYTDLFTQQEIDLSTFLTLSDHDLRELGISTFGARRKMLLAIADLNKRRTLTPMTSSVPRPSSPPGSVVGGRPSSPPDGGVMRVASNALTAGGNSASELFPSPDPPPSLMSARGGPDLASLSGHW